MIIEWEVRVKALCELCTGFAEAKIHLLCCEIVADAITHDAKEAVGIISAAGPEMLWLSPVGNIINTTPLPSLNVGDHVSCWC